MDRNKRQLGLRGLLDKLTPTEENSLEKRNSSAILYNVVGFLAASDFADNGALISNLGCMLSERGLNTCIVDFKVFFPTLYNYLDLTENEKGKGLLTVLRDDKVDIREHINQTKYKQLYLLSPSPYDLIEEYLDFSFEHIELLIDQIKDIFDLVLIDIPNDPALEFCLGAMKYVHRGFMTVSERIESITNVTKLLDFASSIGITTSKFTNLIFVNTQDMNFDYGALKETNYKVVANLPLVRGVIEEYFKGNIYVKHSSIFNRQYIAGMNELVNIIVS